MYACGPVKTTSDGAAPSNARQCGLARAMCATSVPNRPRSASIMNGSSVENDSPFLCVNNTAKL